MANARTFTFTPEHVASLKKLSIFVRPNQNVLHDEILIEPPFLMNAAFWSYAPISVGAFSYTFSTLTSNVATLGRYCSIAADVRFGEAEHPLDRLSTSSFTYDPGFIWKTFLEDQGSAFRPQPLPSEKKRDRISIGNDVWIGARSYIRSGVTVGDGAVIGANAVVTKDVPPYAIVVGNPGRIIRYRFPDPVIEKLIELAWWRFSFADFTGIDLSDIAVAIENIGRMAALGKMTPYAPARVQLERHVTAA